MFLIPYALAFKICQKSFIVVGEYAIVCIQKLHKKPLIVHGDISDFTVVLRLLSRLRTRKMYFSLQKTKNMLQAYKHRRIHQEDFVIYGENPEGH
jgi:hypothetical protein